MRSHVQLSTPALFAAFAVSTMLASCGPEYTYFRVHVTAEDSSDPAAGLDKLYDCRMTVTNSWGSMIVKEYPLTNSFNQSGALVQGCSGPLTKANKGEIGVFGYSTSRTIHALVFKVEGKDENSQTVQSGTGGPIDIPCPAETISPDPEDGGACMVEVPMAVSL